MAIMLRARHLQMLEVLVGPMLMRYIGTGSRSMLHSGIGDALILMCTGTLDRERRLSCHIRTCDAEALLSHSGSALSCLWEGLEMPLVIPAAALEVPLGLLKPTGASQHALKLRIRGDVITVVPTEMRVDQWLGGGYLRTLRASASPGLIVPRLTHHQWQTVVAALEHRRGCDVAIPVNDTTRLDDELLRSTGLTRLDALPAVLRGSRASAVDVVATPRGRDVPVRLIEVEYRNDLRAALHRCAQVLAHLEPRVGAAGLPRVVIVADAARRPAFERYVQEAPHPANGLTARTVFRSFGEVYADAVRLLPRLPHHLRAA